VAVEVGLGVAERDEQVAGDVVGGGGRVEGVRQRVLGAGQGGLAREDHEGGDDEGD
jgi:hypothetical protein